MENSLRTPLSRKVFLLKKYEEFKLQWMIDHGYTLQNLIDQLACFEPLDAERPLEFIYADWEQDVGFGGAIWPCYEEWLENEGAEFNAE